ncbi:DNA mismatch repair protein MutT [Staphylococcus microti]|uniref:DNA mismatch repair protein MutT n=1 Tax=Staphylococcus microti TaxID=569857 RepID=A0A0D6XNG3_9STAP|nr:NUDIX domain-containing protein [Staphylococcus microti]KIX89940.1 DNA mismatch repair protein MutT [Staphylococcus microti]PNZ82342.1 NUDIX domain-containing protein [Staphylococcus microti]SUM57401.1 MutT/nudix family protein [Staphylococcus microti]
MSKFDEQITVVARNILFDNESNAFNGFLSHDDVKSEAILKTLSQYEVKRRGDMEEDPSFKQLISYCILENEDGDILVYQRLSGGGEARLHGLASIGVGGHMNDVPGQEDIMVVIQENASRELLEEVGLTVDETDGLTHIGFINDDNNEVGRVHIGVVFKIKVRKAQVEVRETDTLSIHWQPVDTIDDLSKFESWSALILEKWN